MMTRLELAKLRVSMRRLKILFTAISCLVVLPITNCEVLASLQGDGVYFKDARLTLALEMIRLGEVLKSWTPRLMSDNALHTKHKAGAAFRKSG